MLHYNIDNDKDHNNNSNNNAVQLMMSLVRAGQVLSL